MIFALSSGRRWWACHRGRILTSVKVCPDPVSQRFQLVWKEILPVASFPFVATGVSTPIRRNETTLKKILFIYLVFINYIVVCERWSLGIRKVLQQMVKWQKGTKGTVWRKRSMYAQPFWKPIKQNVEKWEMDGKMKSERAGVLRRQESLPFCSQTQNKDRWERAGRGKGRLEV